MTRAEIVLLAAKRLGDESPDFLTVIDAFFGEVLRDLAAAESIELLRSEAPFDLVLNQESYSTRTMTGMTAPDYPMRVLDVWVPTWGGAGYFQQAFTDDQFKSYRQWIGTDLRGRFRIWQVYPNQSTIRFWPPVGTDDAGVGLGRIVYLAPPTQIASITELEQIRTEDIPTVVSGLVYYGAPYRDESLIDLERAAELYQIGKLRMWGRTHNGEAGRADPQDF